MEKETTTNGLQLQPLYTESTPQLLSDSCNWKKITDSPNLLKWADALWVNSLQDMPSKHVPVFVNFTDAFSSDNRPIYRLVYEKKLLREAAPNEKFALELSAATPDLHLPHAIKQLISHVKEMAIPSEKIFVKTDVSQGLILEMVKIQGLKMAWQKTFGHPVEVVALVSPSSENSTEENNLIRSAIGLSAAVLAGANYIYVPPISPELHGEYASELALKQQIILQQEAHLDFYTTPLQGSHMAETLVADILEELE